MEKVKNTTRNRRGLQMPAHAGGSKLYVGDSWVFRVKPELPIESRRDEDDPQPEISPPNRPRHNYPSS